jgi:hypothetical protein
MLEYRPVEVCYYTLIQSQLTFKGNWYLVLRNLYSFLHFIAIICDLGVNIVEIGM